MAVNLAQTDAEIYECWPVMAQLRPHLKEAEFLPRVRAQMRDGYQLAFVRHEGKAAAVAGFRILENLAWGHFCYVDDLVTDERTRSHGLGAELMKWLKELARERNCERLELDSGVHRHGAHRFYLRERMWISCYHFSLELGGSPGK